MSLRMSVQAVKTGERTMKQLSRSSPLLRLSGK
jgi:hypothetical protein